MLALAFLSGMACGAVLIVLWAVLSNPQVLMGDMKGGCKRCRPD